MGQHSGGRSASPSWPPILIAEDSRVSAEILRAGLAAVGIVNPVVVLGDGVAVMEHLGRALQAGGDGWPVLAVLDVHMPRASGLDVLRWVRGLPSSHAATPVIMLTASGALGDVDEASELGADAYLMKPVGFEALADVVAGLSLQRLLLPTPGS